GDARIACHFFADLHEARTGEVAEEVRLALSAGREQVVGLVLTQTTEDFGQRSRDRLFLAGETRAFDVGDTGLLKVGELLDELLAAEVARQAAEDVVDPASQDRLLVELAPDQAQAGIDQGL